MIDKYVKLSRLPKELQTAISEGAISSRPNVAKNSSVSAVAPSIGKKARCSHWSCYIIGERICQR